MSDINRIRPLLEELAEAINAGLKNGAAISEAIARIKESGYDIILILEVTMGLQERKQTEGQAEETHQPESLVREGEVIPGTFKAKDKKFLHAMKIRLDE